MNEAHKLVASDWFLALVERIALLIQEVLTFPLKTSPIARHELVGLGQASASASRAPLAQWGPSAVGEPFGDTSGAIQLYLDNR